VPGATGKVHGPSPRDIPEADQRAGVTFARHLSLLQPRGSGGCGALDYGRVADLVHATDDVVVSEIESWQAVFGGKHVTVPV
jgi:hypothetical protein